MEVELPAEGDNSAETIKLWSRRVWTLELSLVRAPLSIQLVSSLLSTTLHPRSKVSVDHGRN